MLYFIQSNPNNFTHCSIAAPFSTHSNRKIWLFSMYITAIPANCLKCHLVSIAPDKRTAKQFYWQSLSGPEMRTWLIRRDNFVLLLKWHSQQELCGHQEAKPRWQILDVRINSFIPQVFITLTSSASSNDIVNFMFNSEVTYKHLNLFMCTWNNALK